MTAHRTAEDARLRPEVGNVYMRPDGALYVGALRDTHIEVHAEYDHVFGKPPRPCRTRSGPR